MGFLPGSDSIVNARLVVDGRLAAAAGGPPAHFNPDADKIKPDAEERLRRSQRRFPACRLLVYKSVPPVRIRFTPPANAQRRVSRAVGKSNHDFVRSCTTPMVGRGERRIICRA